MIKSQGEFLLCDFFMSIMDKRVGVVDDKRYTVMLIRCLRNAKADEGGCSRSVQAVSNALKKLGHEPLLLPFSDRITDILDVLKR